MAQDNTDGVAAYIGQQLTKIFKKQYNNILDDNRVVADQYTVTATMAGTSLSLDFARVPVQCHDVAAIVYITLIHSHMLRQKGEQVKDQNATRLIEKDKLKLNAMTRFFGSISADTFITSGDDDATAANNNNSTFEIITQLSCKDHGPRLPERKLKSATQKLTEPLLADEGPDARLTRIVDPPSSASMSIGPNNPSNNRNNSNNNKGESSNTVNNAEERNNEEINNEERTAKERTAEERTAEEMTAEERNNEEMTAEERNNEERNNEERNNEERNNEPKKIESLSNQVTLYPKNERRNRIEYNGENPVYAELHGDGWPTNTSSELTYIKDAVLNAGASDPCKMLSLITPNVAYPYTVKDVIAHITRLWSNKYPTAQFPSCGFGSKEQEAPKSAFVNKLSVNEYLSARAKNDGGIVVKPGSIAMLGGTLDSTLTKERLYFVSNSGNKRRLVYLQMPDDEEWPSNIFDETHELTKIKNEVVNLAMKKTWKPFGSNVVSDAGRCNVLNTITADIAYPFTVKDAKTFINRLRNKKIQTLHSTAQIEEPQCDTFDRNAFLRLTGDTLGDLFEYLSTIPARKKDPYDTSGTMGYILRIMDDGNKCDAMSSAVYKMTHGDAVNSAIMRPFTELGLSPTEVDDTLKRIALERCDSDKKVDDLNKLSNNNAAIPDSSAVEGVVVKRGSKKYLKPNYTEWPTNSTSLLTDIKNNVLQLDHVINKKYGLFGPKSIRDKDVKARCALLDAIDLKTASPYSVADAKNMINHYRDEKLRKEANDANVVVVRPDCTGFTKDTFLNMKYATLDRAVDYLYNMFQKDVADKTVEYILGIFTCPKEPNALAKIDDDIAKPLMDGLGLSKNEIIKTLTRISEEYKCEQPPAGGGRRTKNNKKKRLANDSPQK